MVIKLKHPFFEVVCCRRRVCDYVAKFVTCAGLFLICSLNLCEASTHYQFWQWENLWDRYWECSACFHVVCNLFCWNLYSYRVNVGVFVLLYFEQCVSLCVSQMLFAIFNLYAILVKSFPNESVESSWNMRTIHALWDLHFIYLITCVNMLALPACSVFFQLLVLLSWRP